MDKLAFYRQSVRDLLTRYHADEKPKSEQESQLVFDEQRDRYLWLYSHSK